MLRFPLFLDLLITATSHVAYFDDSLFALYSTIAHISPINFMQMSLIQNLPMLFIYIHDHSKVVKVDKLYKNDKCIQVLPLRNSLLF